MNPHSDEQGITHTHMHTNDFACIYSNVHVCMHRCHYAPPFITSTPTASGGKEEMSFLRIEYSGMSFATLTLHMQNPELCIHAERHKTGTTIKNVISLPL